MSLIEGNKTTPTLTTPTFLPYVTPHFAEFLETKIGHEQGPEGSDLDGALCGPYHTSGPSLGTPPGPGGAPKGAQNSKNDARKYAVFSCIFRPKIGVGVDFHALN